jgi:hypothetical protein
MTPLLDAWQDWECPNCTVAERTRPLPPNASRFHTCAGLHGLTAPLVRAGTDCKVTAVERGDYLAGEEQRTGDDGRPYMAVRTDHADGSNDLAVFPGVAAFGGRAGET